MSATTVSALERDERGVVIYTIDDAPARNALSTAILQDIDQSLSTLAGDPSVRVLVFTGAGATFSSGANRSEIADPQALERTTDLLVSILIRIDEAPFPVLARINGAAFGAGLAIAAAADISIACDDGIFGLPEVRFGLVAGPAAAAVLPRIGHASGLDLLLTGRRFDGAEAARLGLFTEIVSRTDLDAAVDARISDLLQGDPQALALTRRLVRRVAGMGMAERVAALMAAAKACAR